MALRCGACGCTLQQDRCPNARHHILLKEAIKMSRDRGGPLTCAKVTYHDSWEMFSNRPFRWRFSLNHVGSRYVVVPKLTIMPDLRMWVYRPRFPHPERPAESVHAVFGPNTQSGLMNRYGIGEPAFPFRYKTKGVVDGTDERTA